MGFHNEHWSERSACAALGEEMKRGKAVLKVEDARRTCQGVLMGLGKYQEDNIRNEAGVRVDEETRCASTPNCFEDGKGKFNEMGEGGSRTSLSKKRRWGRSGDGGGAEMSSRTGGRSQVHMTQEASTTLEMSLRNRWCALPLKEGEYLNLFLLHLMAYNGPLLHPGQGLHVHHHHPQQGLINGHLLT